METVQVRTARPYAVQIDCGLMKQAGSLIAKAVHGRRAAVITDAAVGSKYAGALTEQLRASGFAVSVMTVECGEQIKDLSHYADVLRFLAKSGLDRTDAVIGLGGGTVSDLAGFAAATYLRGTELVLVPTTLLAQVDAAVGGKNGIDLPQGKNLVGTVWQPALVLCDTAFLDELPRELLRQGSAEIVKYAVLGDIPLFDHMWVHGLDFARDWVIRRCLEAKADRIQGDELDHSQRRYLNLGHTGAHAVELCSGYSIPHGPAVAIGLTMAARAAVAWGLCPKEEALRISVLLERLGLPTVCTFSVDALYRAALADKKRAGDSVTVVLPRRIGACTLQRISLEHLQDFFSPVIAQ